jgi:hypothetical protein
LIAAQVFCKKSHEWELSKLRTEYELKKEFAVEKAKQQAATVMVKPTKGTQGETLWLFLMRGSYFITSREKGSWQPVFLEIDRGTEQQKFFKRQIRAHALFLADGGYKKLFGTNKGVIAYATTGITTRFNTMRTWTHQVLTELDVKKLSSRFHFCSLTPSWEQDEHSVFLALTWYRASYKHPVPLLA